MTAPVLIDRIARNFGHLTALAGISFEIEAGELIVLLGPSGCGKTTLLSVLGGFLPPTSGRIWIGGKDVTDVPPAKRPTTTMFQDYALFPHMRLKDNVGFGLRMRGIGKDARMKRALDMLDLVGLRAAADKKPHELSGGERQRVALARALAVDPDVLLLDEPLGALDLKLRRQMQDELKAIQKRVGTTFVHVTHDQEEAMAIADRIVVMNSGRIEDSGAPADIYMRPRSLFSASFMGEVNFVPGTVNRTDGQTAVVASVLGDFVLPCSCFPAQAPTSGQEIMLCIRPEHFRGADKGDGLTVSLGDAAIVDMAFLGTHHRCHLRPTSEPQTEIVAHMPQSPLLAKDGRLALTISLKNVIALPRQSGEQ